MKRYSYIPNGISSIDIHEYNTNKNIIDNKDFVDYDLQIVYCGSIKPIYGFDKIFPILENNTNIILHIYSQYNIESYYNSIPNNLISHKPVSRNKLINIISNYDVGLVMADPIVFSNTGISFTKSSSGTIIFIFLCAMGGSLISNSSGIKFIRIYILIKSAAAEIIRLVRPNNVFNNLIFYSEKKIDNQIINLSFLIFISFFISIFILSSILVLDDINFESSFKLSILTLTNTTNSSLYGVSNINFANLLNSTKLFLIIFMIIGKIELISILILFKKLLFKE